MSLMSRAGQMSEPRIKGLARPTAGLRFHTSLSRFDLGRMHDPASNTSYHFLC